MSLLEGKTMDDTNLEEGTGRATGTGRGVRWYVAGLAALVVGSSLVVSPAFGSEVTSIAPEKLLARFASAQDAADRLPHDIEHLEMGFIASSSRYLTSDELGDFWVVLNDVGHVCLAAWLESHGGLTSAACTSPLEFHRSGLSLRVRAAASTDYDSFSVSLLLVSDDAATGDVEGTELAPGFVRQTQSSDETL